MDQFSVKHADIGLAKTFFTLMRSLEIQFRTDGNDPERIDCFVAVVVMLFDVFEIHSLLNSGLLIQIPGVSKEFRIVSADLEQGQKMQYLVTGLIILQLMVILMSILPSNHLALVFCLV